eukprot:tig00020805_g14017.t2
MPATQRKPEHKTDQAALLECIERIYADFRSRSTAHLILLGDWNSVKTPATSRIRAGRFVQSWTPEREWWGKLTGTWALVDAATQKGHEHEVTFIRRGPSQHGAEEDGGDDGADDSDSEQDQQMDGPAVAEGAAVISAGRIDAVLHSAGLAPALLAVHPLPPEVALPHPSDHFPVMADYDLLKAELARPPAGDARPAHPPPLFAPHLLEKEKLPAFRKAVEDQLGAHVRSLTDGAGGPSNCTNAILKTLWNPDLPDAMDPEAYPPRGRRLLMAIVCEALRLRDLPAEMCESNIFGIPKNGSWDGDIEGNLRPITLQEVGLKLTTGLVTKRLAEAIEKHGILKGVNYGFRKAKATDDALHLMVAILEDAKEHRKPIYLLLQDIRRAYDSVSWASMELSLRRIGAPETRV